MNVGLSNGVMTGEAYMEDLKGTGVLGVWGYPGGSKRQNARYIPRTIHILGQ